MAKSNIRQVELSGGELKYNRLFELTISDQGTGSDNIDFSQYTFEEGTGNKPSHIRIINDGGVNPVWFVFDAAGSTIATTDNTTYNGKAYAGTPFSMISYDGICSSVGFRCAAGKTTTVKVLAW